MTKQGETSQSEVDLIHLSEDTASLIGKAYNPPNGERDAENLKKLMLWADSILLDLSILNTIFEGRLAL